VKLISLLLRTLLSTRFFLVYITASKKYTKFARHILLCSALKPDTEPYEHIHPDRSDSPSIASSHTVTMSQPNNTQAGTNHDWDKCWEVMDRPGPDLPKTALPAHDLSDKIGFQKAFLAAGYTLDESIVSIVVGSATLKAWFAVIFPDMRRRSASAKKFIAPSWASIWNLAKTQMATWNKNFCYHGHPETQWELHEPSSVGELYALAMFVIYRNVLDNPEKDGNHVDALKWRKGYDEDEGKFFLLYKFLSFMGSYCTGDGVIQFDRPIGYGYLKVRAWKESRGGRMHTAVQQFLTGE
jgi:hypothetical protein